jgi:hypothetical protein
LVCGACLSFFLKYFPISGEMKSPLLGTTSAGGNSLFTHSIYNNYIFLLKGELFHPFNYVLKFSHSKRNQYIVPLHRDLDQKGKRTRSKPRCITSSIILLICGRFFYPVFPILSRSHHTQYTPALLLPALHPEAPSEPTHAHASLLPRCAH